MPPGVKGLAAMFEQRGDSNPADDRGRSPGPGMTRSLGGMYFVRILQLFSIVVLSSYSLFPASPDFLPLPRGRTGILVLVLCLSSPAF